MKRLFIYSILMTMALTACVNDDTYSWEENFADKTDTDTINISIIYGSTTATVTGDDYGFVTVSGTDVTVKSNTNKFLQLTLSGSCSDGSLLTYSWKKLGVVLNGLTLTNSKGPAINNQCGKSFVVTLADGTTNTLTDGTSYAQAPINAAGDTIDQKGTLFSEGQIYFRGNGQLTINANAKNGVASDDYVIMEGGTVSVNVSDTGSNGIKVNDGFTITGGTLSIETTAAGGRGIKNDSYTLIAGGTTTITTTGDCKKETEDGVTDTTACAGVKSDSLFTMTGGSLTITCKGDGGKGINCSQDINISGGRLAITTVGSSNESKAHGIKSDKNITFTNGEVYVCSSRKAFATDSLVLINGGTVLGIGYKQSTPSTSSLQSYNSYDKDDEIDVVGGEQFTIDNVTYTIPSIYSRSNAYVVVSGSNM